MIISFSKINSMFVLKSELYSRTCFCTYNVAEDSRSHQVCHLRHLEDINRPFGLHLASQRHESTERSCRDSAHTGQMKGPVIVICTNVLMTSQSEEVLLIVDYSGSLRGSALVFHQVDKLERVADGTVWVRPVGDTVVFHVQNVVILVCRQQM